MFERYTERARRVIFFARYEASQFGSTTIETEHFLLGLIREDKKLIEGFLPDSSPAEIRKEVESRSSIREKVSTSIDLPLSHECKRILAYAAEEAGRLNHRHIGTASLLLGILREEKCVAAEILQAGGLRLDAIREDLERAPVQEDLAASGPADLGARLRSFFPFVHSPALPQAGVVPDADTAIRIAEAVWLPLHGTETLERRKPFHAELQHRTVWLVTGSSEPVGAELCAFILKADGRILAMGAPPAEGQKPQGA